MPFPEQLLTSLDGLLSRLDGATGELERTLQSLLHEYRLAVVTGASPVDIRNSTAALMRFCTEHMDWDSELYRRIQSLAAQARGKSD